MRAKPKGAIALCRSVYDLIKGKVPFVPNGGLSFVDIRDAADAFCIAMQRGQPGDSYLLGSNNWTLREYFGSISRLSGLPVPRLSVPNSAAYLCAVAIHALLGAVGRRDPTFDPVYVGMSQAYWYLESGKASRELGITYRSADDTLLDTINWLRQHM